MLDLILYIVWCTITYYYIGLCHVYILNVTDKSDAKTLMLVWPLGLFYFIGVAAEWVHKWVLSGPSSMVEANQKKAREEK